jgi:predicted amidophosphoribosyltransferase
VLAEAIAARAQQPVLDCLVRRGSDDRQVGRGRAARLAGPAGAFVATGAVPDRVALVDDVVTTGATLAACARALHAGGARQVVALSFARTPGR